MRKSPLFLGNIVYLQRLILAVHLLDLHLKLDNPQAQILDKLASYELRKILPVKYKRFTFEST